MGERACGAVRCDAWVYSPIPFWSKKRRGTPDIDGDGKRLIACSSLSDALDFAAARVAVGLDRAASVTASGAPAAP